MTTAKLSKEWCLRMARLEGASAISAGANGQLVGSVLHDHWAAYPEAEVLFNCAQAIVEYGSFPAAMLARATALAYDTGVQEATAYLESHGIVGNIFPDCGANTYFSNLEKSAQLLSGTADTTTGAYALRGVLAEIGEAYRLGWEHRGSE